MNNPGEIKGFCPKTCNLRFLSNLFIYVMQYSEPDLLYDTVPRAVADLGGGCIPPTSLKVTILAEKSALILNNSAPVRDASPPDDLNVTNPAEKSVSILVKTFFFFLETT